MLRFLALALPVFGLSACGYLNPKMAFNPKLCPHAPCYAELKNWAAHPDKKDPADLTPTPQTLDNQANADVDVFFLHPTTLTGDSKCGHNRCAWNDDLADSVLNKKTDDTPIQYQASIFNGSCRVFAPRYRQAHLNSFFTKDTVSAACALDTAYADVRSAFLYYLKNWNHGRPIVLAAHSQGSAHAMHLLREFFDGKALGSQLVAAYLVGWPVPRGTFAHIPACQNADQTGCFCSWRTFRRSYGLKVGHQDNVVCTNPLSWTIDPGIYMPKEANRGAVVLDFNKPLPKVSDAEVYRGILLCRKPDFPGSWVFKFVKNYHPGDLNLYYFDVRANVERRVGNFLGKK